MRVGSFVLLRDKTPKGYDAIVHMPRLGVLGVEWPSRFAYDRLSRVGYIESAMQFLKECGDQDPVDTLGKLWPELKKVIEDFIQSQCIKELLNEPPEMPF